MAPQVKKKKQRSDGLRGDPPTVQDSDSGENRGPQARPSFGHSKLLSLTTNVFGGRIGRWNRQSDSNASAPVAALSSSQDGGAEENNLSPAHRNSAGGATTHGVARGDHKAPRKFKEVPARHSNSDLFRGRLAPRIANDPHNFSPPMIPSNASPKHSHSPQHSTTNAQSPQHSSAHSPQHSSAHSPQHSSAHSPQHSSAHSPQHSSAHSPQHSSAHSPQHASRGGNYHHHHHERHPGHHRHGQQHLPRHRGSGNPFGGEGGSDGNAQPLDAATTEAVSSLLNPTSPAECVFFTWLEAQEKKSSDSSPVSDLSGEIKPEALMEMTAPVVPVAEPFEWDVSLECLPEPEFSSVHQRLMHLVHQAESSPSNLAVIRSIYMSFVAYYGVCKAIYKQTQGGRPSIEARMAFRNLFLQDLLSIVEAAVAAKIASYSHENGSTDSRQHRRAGITAGSASADGGEAEGSHVQISHVQITYIKTTLMQDVSVADGEFWDHVNMERRRSGNTNLGREGVRFLRNLLDEELRLANSGSGVFSSLGRSSPESSDSQQLLYHATSDARELQRGDSPVLDLTSVLNKSQPLKKLGKSLTPHLEPIAEHGCLEAAAPASATDQSRDHQHNLAQEVVAMATQAMGRHRVTRLSWCLSFLHSSHQIFFPAVVLRAVAEDLPMISSNIHFLVLTGKEPHELYNQPLSNVCDTTRFVNEGSAIRAEIRRLRASNASAEKGPQQQHPRLTVHIKNQFTGTFYCCILFLTKGDTSDSAIAVLAHVPSACTFRPDRLDKILEASVPLIDDFLKEKDFLP